MSTDNELKQKLLQELLFTIRSNVKEAQKLAEELGEIITISYGTYVPSVYGDENRLRELALIAAKQNGRKDYGRLPNGTYGEILSVSFDQLDEEGRNELIEGIIDDMKCDLPEYANPGQWWLPSNC